MRPFRNLTRPLLCGTLAVLLTATAHAADSKREVTQDQAKLLAEVAKLEAPAALKTLSEYKGAAHPLITLVLGQTHWRLASAALNPTEADFHRRAAEKAFAEALAADATLRQAHLGLAQCAAARQDWNVACKEAGAGIDPTLGDRSEVTFLAHAALQAQDWHLAGIAAQQGILRFPDDRQLRRIELAVLQQAGRSEDVRQVALALLAQDPDDVDLWRRLAWAARETHREDEALAAYEAALLLTPSDRTLRRALADIQLSRGMPQAALANFRVLIGQPVNAEAASDAGMMVSASRAAADAGELALGRSWLDAVPESARSRALRLQAARLAIQANDQDAAAKSLDALIALGEADASVLAWAGSLAQSRGELAQAELFYLKAASADGPAAGAASLRLVALYLTQGRRDEARTTLAAHLVKRPDDQQAKALQAQLDRSVAPR